MLWQLRVTALLHCLRYGRVRAAVESLKFMIRRLDFAVVAVADGVLDWEGAATCAGASFLPPSAEGNYDASH